VHGGERKIELANETVVHNGFKEIRRLFHELCTQFDFISLVPPTVEVVAVTKNNWGTHVELIDDTMRHITAYQVDVSEDILGCRFYLVASTNPFPLQPQLIKRVPFAERDSVSNQGIKRHSDRQ